jgi:hypothetical protein
MIMTRVVITHGCNFFVFMIIRYVNTFYSCGVTYRDWISSDNPMRVHRRISPSCSLVINNVSNRYFEDNSVLYGNSDRSSVSNNGNSQQCVNQTNTVNTQTARFNSDARDNKYVLLIFSVFCPMGVFQSSQSILSDKLTELYMLRLI